jgi:hypothetical protein
MKISLKQANLMLRSHIIHEYPWLHKLLLEFGKIGLDDVPVTYHDEFLNVGPFIIKQCGEEWKGNDEVAHPVDDLGSERMPCGLCGTPNRYIYYIQNRINGNTLNVGSDCVEEFIDTDLLREGKSKGQLLKKAKLIRRLSVVNSKFPGIDRFVMAWFNYLDRFKVLIPHRLEDPYTIEGERLLELYTDYLDENVDEDVFDEIGLIKSKHAGYISEMTVYEESVINEPYVATKEIATWLLEKNDYKTVELLKETGMITSETISHIWERTFISRIAQHIDRLLDSLPLKLEDLDFDYRAFILRSEKPDVRLFCSFEKFLVYFGSLLFGDQSVAGLTLQNIVKISNMPEQDHIETLIKHIQTSIRRSKIDISINGDSISNNQIDLFDRASDLVVVDDLRKFTTEFKGLAFSFSKPTISDLELYVKELPGKRYKKRELLEIRREVKREFSRR